MQAPPGAAADDDDAPGDDSAACAGAFRSVKQLLADWLRDVIHENNEQADLLLTSAYRWLCSSASLLYDPAVHRLLHGLMKKVWLQLLAEAALIILHYHPPPYTGVAAAAGGAALARRHCRLR
jgi:DNA polymerase epsilon subunit 1